MSRTLPLPRKNIATGLPDDVRRSVHLYRAILEGIAFEQRLNITGVEAAVGRFPALQPHLRRLADLGEEPGGTRS